MIWVKYIKSLHMQQKWHNGKGYIKQFFAKLLWDDLKDMDLSNTL